MKIRALGPPKTKGKTHEENFTVRDWLSNVRVVERNIRLGPDINAGAGSRRDRTRSDQILAAGPDGHTTRPGSEGPDFFLGRV